MNETYKKILERFTSRQRKMPMADEAGFYETFGGSAGLKALMMKMIHEGNKQRLFPLVNNGIEDLKKAILDYMKDLKLNNYAWTNRKSEPLED